VIYPARVNQFNERNIFIDNAASAPDNFSKRQDDSTMNKALRILLGNSKNQSGSR
jgi:hypothetical protein